MIPDLSAFLGTWQVLRVIRHGDGSVARFAGQTVWAPDGDRLIERETGKLMQGAQSFDTSRSTVWRAESEAIAVSFPDGRPFHQIDGGVRTRAYHDCPPDAYWLSYDFTLWPRWSVRWDVSGPRKSYRALSRYSPVTAP